MAPRKVNENVKTSIDRFLSNPRTVTAIVNEYRGVLRSYAQRRNLRGRVRQRLQRLQNHFTTQPEDSTTAASEERLKRILADPETATQILHSATDVPLSLRSDLADRISNRLQTLKQALNNRMKASSSDKSTDVKPAVGDDQPKPSMNLFKKPLPPTKNMSNGEWHLNIYHPSNGKINAHQITQIRMQMMLDCVSAELGLFCPRFGRSRPLKGKLHVVCLDRRSMDWLTQHVELMGFAWNYDVPIAPARGKQHQLMQKPRTYSWSAFFYVDQPVSKDFVLELLQRQNQRLDLSRWEIVQFDTVIRDGWTGMGDNGCYSGHFIVFAMPMMCQRQLLMQNCGLHFGLNVVRLDRFY